MAKRQLKRVDTSKVQGEGSHVLIRPLTFGEMQEIQSAGRERQSRRVRLNAERLRANNKNDDDALARVQNELAELETEANDETRRIMARCVEKWDWVDYDGTPLPLPKDDPSVVDRLESWELEIISDAIWGNDVKN